MACNCKKATEIYDKYEVKGSDDYFAAKAYKTFWKFIAFLAILFLCVVFVPLFVAYAMYKIVFAREKTIKIPFMNKKI